mmetsp:Transcript_13755/g.33869  ORF Transcript_13755/g.33869 Transcript_13755/m.33869 type:complete len:318 (+) Transcript_13755:84-1037(+)
MDSVSRQPAGWAAAGQSVERATIRGFAFGYDDFWTSTPSTVEERDSLLCNKDSDRAGEVADHFAGRSLQVHPRLQERSAVEQSVLPTLGTTSTYKAASTPRGGQELECHSAIVISVGDFLASAGIACTDQELKVAAPREAPAAGTTRRRQQRIASPSVGGRLGADVWGNLNLVLNSCSRKEKKKGDSNYFILFQQAARQFCFQREDSHALPQGIYYHKTSAATAANAWLKPSAGMLLACVVLVLLMSTSVRALGSEAGVAGAGMGALRGVGNGNVISFRGSRSGSAAEGPGPARRAESDSSTALAAAEVRAVNFAIV